MNDVEKFNAKSDAIVSAVENVTKIAGALAPIAERALSLLERIHAAREARKAKEGQ